MKEKYANYKDDFFITTSKVEIEFFVNRYYNEHWKFNGNNVIKNVIVKDMSSTVEIPETTYTVQEFLTYSDEIAKFRTSLVEPVPIQPKKF